MAVSKCKTTRRLRDCMKIEMKKEKKNQPKLICAMRSDCNEMWNMELLCFQFLFSVCCLLHFLLSTAKCTCFFFLFVVSFLFIFPFRLQSCIAHIVSSVVHCSNCVGALCVQRLLAVETLVTSISNGFRYNFIKYGRIPGRIHKFVVIYLAYDTRC